MKPSHSQKQSLLLRYSNTRGDIIPMHRAFKTLHLGIFSRVVAFILPVVFSGLVWKFLPDILTFWSEILRFWTAHVVQSEIGYTKVLLLGQELELPYPAMEAEAPSHFAIVLNLVICAWGLIVSLLLPAGGIPLHYFLRTVLLIQGSASVDRLIASDFFPYTIQIYVTDAMQESVYLLVLLPLILGLVYYIFDFAIWRKCLLTLIMLGYFIIAIPCQYMMNAYLIYQGSLLFLPLMYMIFGILIDVLMFVSLYAYGMSWPSRKTALQGRVI